MELCQKLGAAFAQEGITSLNLEDLLSVSFIVIDDLYEHHFPDGMPHRGVPNSNLADSEVITIAWGGEMVSIDSQRVGITLSKRSSAIYFRIYLSELDLIVGVVICRE